MKNTKKISLIIEMRGEDYYNGQFAMDNDVWCDAIINNISSATNTSQLALRLYKSSTEQYSTAYYTLTEVMGLEL